MDGEEARCREWEELHAEITQLRDRISRYEQSDTEANRNLERYQRLMAQIGGVTYLHDFASNCYLHLDPAIEALLGVPAAQVNRQLWSSIVEDVEMRGPAAGLTVQEATRRFRSGEHTSWNAEYLVRWSDGHTRWLSDSSILLADDTGKHTGSFGVLRDITEEKTLQQNLFQVQKMESIGRLAGSVAHDFNNMLTAIMGYADLARYSLAEEDPATNYLQRLVKAAKNAALLTRQLLTFARCQVIQPRVLDLNQQLSEMAAILKPMLGENVDVKLSLAPDLPAIKADPNQLEQVILNMAVNARDAMPQGGTFLLETTQVILTEDTKWQRPELRPGDYVRLSLRDTGIGIKEEIQEQIFEPFFTTKPKGMGTGLGLATCYGIVKQAGGHIEVNSRPGSGTLFTIYLPRTRETPDCAAVRTAVAALGGTETVLLAEDEDQVREIALQALRRRGYYVLSATNGVEALRIAKEFPHSIDMLVSDVIMPIMGGIDLVKRLQSARPETKVLLVSGYMDEIDAPEELGGDIAFLQKPYTAEILARKVREVLDSAKA